MNFLSSSRNLMLDSREVAEMVEKDHNKLLRDIRLYIEHLNEAKIGHVDYFIESTYIDGKGEERPCYLITKMGCEMVACKLTGSKGVVFTARYVKKFNELESGSVSLSLQLDGDINQLKEVLAEVKQYYRLPHATKMNFMKRIKSKLGAEATDQEIRDVKEYVFVIMGIEKWEDLPISEAVKVVDLIDRRCNIIKSERITLFNFDKM